MYEGKLVFSQVMDFLPRHEFDKSVRRYRGNYRTRGFSCRDQFLAMAFAQLTYRESLRDIETCLRSVKSKLYHLGFRGNISRSTLADANRRRDWRIYADFAQGLIERARALYLGEPLAGELAGTAYAFDSTTIDLCLSLFPWAPFRTHKAAVKLHTLLDLRGSIPCFMRVSPGNKQDVRVLDELPIERGAFYVMDKAYIDFTRLYRFETEAAYFVTRAKRNMLYRRRKSLPIDKQAGLRSDQVIVLTGKLTATYYPGPLRRIHYYDATNDKRFIFLSNNFVLPALTITELYRSRWQIELFFKWIKQHLRIKAFYGNTPNAVRTQLWIAMCTYLLIALLKKELKIERSLADILQIVSVNPLEKTPLLTLLQTPTPNFLDPSRRKQLPLFDF